MSQEEKDKIKEYQRKKYQELLQYKKKALKNKYFFLFLYFLFFFLSIKTSEKRLKFNKIKLNKKEFHKSKEPIDLLSVDLDQTVILIVSSKFKHNNEDFKHFIGYLENGIDKPLCIILPQMNGYKILWKGW